MLEQAQQHFPLETGGMLLGYESNDDIVLTKIIGAGPNAKHGYSHFVPDGEYQQSALEEHFWATDGRETYLGDWHTHPKGKNKLSPLDKRTLACIANEPLSGTKHPLMAIFACGGGTWDLGVVRFLSVERHFFWNEYQLKTLNPIPF